MQERGLDPGYSSEAREQILGISQPAEDLLLPDLRAMPWCSIDNGEGEEVSSRDLDQITAASPLGDGQVKLYVAIADVDALLPKDSPADIQAQQNTTTVYRAARTWPMIHPHFSEGLTSFNEGEDRVAVVTEMTVSPQGQVTQFSIYRAQVHNHVKLNYDSVGRWLEGQGPPPQALRNKEAVLASIQLQDVMAQKLKEVRWANGSLELESLEARARLEEGRVVDIKGQLRNHATELIENLMVACNGCTSRYLKSKNLPTFQRIVRVPKFWDKIVEVAADKGQRLPDEADSASLQRFLEGQRASDPLHFPDLSLQILKLLGRGEYVVEMPNEPPIGHFGLAVREYSHSTAPNRRYPDIITQRLLKAALAGLPSPYEAEELEILARRCSQQEAAAQKVERQTSKSAAASMLSNRVGETFKAVVSGQNNKATWVRLLTMPIEGKLEGQAKMGQRLRVKLVSVNVEKGFIDFRPTH